MISTLNFTPKKPGNQCNRGITWTNLGATFTCRLLYSRPVEVSRSAQCRMHCSNPNRMNDYEQPGSGNGAIYTLDESAKTPLGTEARRTSKLTLDAVALPFLESLKELPIPSRVELE